MRTFPRRSKYSSVLESPCQKRVSAFVYSKGEKSATNILNSASLRRANKGTVLRKVMLAANVSRRAAVFISSPIYCKKGYLNIFNRVGENVSWNTECLVIIFYYRFG